MMSPISLSTRPELSPTTASSQALYRHDIAPHHRLLVAFAAGRRSTVRRSHKPSKIAVSTAAPSPSLTADDLFTEYDTDVLRSIADRFAPVHEVRSRVRTLTVVRRRMPGHSPCLPRAGKTISTDQDRQRSFCLLLRVRSKEEPVLHGRNELPKNGATQRSYGGRCLRFCVGTTQTK